MGDDFNYFGVAITGVAHRQNFRGGDFAAVLGQCFRELDRGRGFCIFAAAGTIGFDLGVTETCLAADGGMRRYAVIAGILLSQRQRDALTGLRLQATLAGDFMQTQESLQRGG